MDLSQDSDLRPNKNLSEIEPPLAKTQVGSYFYCNNNIIILIRGDANHFRKSFKKFGFVKEEAGEREGKKNFSKSFNCHAHPIHDLEVWQSSENFSSLHKISTHHHDHADISCSVTMRSKSL